MLTDKDVKHIADLARIKIDEKEEKKIQKVLSSILGYIDKLNEVDTTKVEPLYQTTGLVDSFRSDESRGEFRDDPVRSLARARGVSPKDLGEATSNGMNEKLIGQ